jgi:hypothetical protein
LILDAQTRYRSVLTRQLFGIAPDNRGG